MSVYTQQISKKLDIGEVHSTNIQAN